MQEEEEDYEEKEVGETCGIPEIHGEDDSGIAYMMQQDSNAAGGWGGGATPAPNPRRGPVQRRTWRRRREYRGRGRRKVEPQPGRPFRPCRPRRDRAASSAAVRGRCRRKGLKKVTV